MVKLTIILEGSEEQLNEIAEEVNISNLMFKYKEYLTDFQVKWED